MWKTNNPLPKQLPSSTPIEGRLDSLKLSLQSPPETDELGVCVLPRPFVAKKSFRDITLNYAKWP